MTIKPFSATFVPRISSNVFSNWRYELHSQASKKAKTYTPVGGRKTPRVSLGSYKFVYYHTPRNHRSSLLMFRLPHLCFDAGLSSTPLYVPCRTAVMYHSFFKGQILAICICSIAAKNLSHGEYSGSQGFTGKQTVKWTIVASRANLVKRTKSIDTVA